jgi:hypothetical protein
VQLRGAKSVADARRQMRCFFWDEPEIPSARPRFEQDVYVHVQVPLPSRQTHNTVEGALGGSRAQTLRSMTLTI